MASDGSRPVRHRAQRLAVSLASDLQSRSANDFDPGRVRAADDHATPSLRARAIETSSVLFALVRKLDRSQLGC